ncbi:MAG: hypothetical protein LBI39_02075 [Puniceicoccales bacterium]|nr:hypothetical protein [Puniceicoccales bacterium]
MSIIPQCNFESFGGVREQFDILAKEHLCNWIRRKKDATFDYGEILEQIQIVKARFSKSERDYVLRCHERSFVAKALLPEILSWGKNMSSVSLLAILYTMPSGADTTPRHLLSALLDVNARTGRPDGDIFMEMRIDYHEPIRYSIRISDFMDPSIAKVEECGRS